MYGTIARMRARQGADFRAVVAELESRPVRGHLATYVYQMDRDSREYFVVVLFADKESYFANAESPEQHADYLRLLEHLEAPPEWHDGQMMWSIVRDS